LAVLQHFHDEVVFTSPVATKLRPKTAGVLRGKPALRRYWTLAVQRIPDLRFAVEGVYQGIDTIVITYRKPAQLNRPGSDGGSDTSRAIQTPWSTRF
jgi:hypothetical protein